MVELSSKRVEQILHEKTPKTESLETILRAIYTRYMQLYERYFADIDDLNDDLIAELSEFHDETASLVKYYGLAVVQMCCSALLVLLGTKALGWPAAGVKPVVDILLFLVSFQIQKRFVFKD